MSEKIVQLNEEVIKGQLKELVRGSVEETLNELLEAEAEKLTQAARYERNEQRQGYRSGHYNRSLTTTSGDVTLKVPKLKGISFETAIIERYRRRESSVEEALIEMYLAGVSVRRVEDITEALWGSKVSPSTISELNKKAYVHIEDWRNRPLQGGHYPYVYVDGIYIRKNGVINNEEALKADLLNIIHKIDEGEMYQPMLKELINAERVNIIKNVRDWKEAIKIASKPLLEDNSIEELYIENMIKSVEKYGPYIVLADRFALPHASSKEGVNKLAMSLLIVEDEVDLLGKPVNIFMVLAAVDNTTHIRALASLSEMMYEEENVKLIINGDKSSILELINKQN